jgi:predicted Zn-dependent protease
MAALVLCACTTDREERELGEKAAEQVRQQVELLGETDPVTVWARQLLDSLVPASARFRSPTAVGGYRLDVIDDDGMVNAFALPGGHLYLATGLVLQAHDCAEIAGVLAHEMGHVVERHAMERLAAAKTGHWLTRMFLGSGTGGDVAEAAFAVMQGTAFSRRDEAEADAVGVRIAGGAGYDPHGVARFLERAAGGGRSASFFDSHPATAERAAAIDGIIAAEFPAPAGVACPVEARPLAAIQEELRRRARARP